MRSFYCLVVVLALLRGPAALSAAEVVPLVGDTVARFATADAGVAALTADDAFTQSLSRFDLQCRLQKAEPATLEEWRTFVAGEVRPWDEKHVAKVEASLERLRPRLAKLNLPLPDTILLVHTTGKEEGDAAYTRGAAIVLPVKVLGYPAAQFDRLLAHELFHVLSRHQPMLRSELYGVIGFQTCPPIALPPSLAHRKITNPDAPLVDCYIELASGEKSYFAAPVLYASAKEYDAKAGGSLFKYLTFRLMVIEKHDGKWQPVLKEDKAVVIDPKQEPAFFDKIGKNTNYIIHPDEILADNFVHLVMGDQNLPTPWIVERMARILSKP